MDRRRSAPAPRRRSRPARSRRRARELRVACRSPRAIAVGEHGPRGDPHRGRRPGRVAGSRARRDRSSATLVAAAPTARVDGRALDRTRSTSAFDSYGALLARDVPPPGDVARGAIADALRHRGRTSTSSTRARRGQRRDPRPAAPRRLGVRRRVDGRARATACSPSSSRSSRPSCSTGSSRSASAIGLEVVPLGPDVPAPPCSRALASQPHRVPAVRPRPHRRRRRGRVLR